MDMADRPAKRRRLFPSQENSITPVTCCSSIESTQSSDLTKEITKNADLEDDSSTCTTDSRDINRSSRREKMAESGEIESTVRAPLVGKSVLAEKMPSEAELEEFFAAAEKEIHKKFAEKYNFDVTKEQPLEGCYEWVKMKP